MGKYMPLTEWLKRQPRSSVELTFARIEEIIGDALPPNAREYLRGWDNTPGSAINDSFYSAGWETVMVDLENGRVKFQRRKIGRF